MANPDFQTFMTTIFYSFISGTALIMVRILAKMQGSIDTLNKHVTELLTHHAHQEKTNEEIKDRLVLLESERPNEKRVRGGSKNVH